MREGGREGGKEAVVAIRERQRLSLPKGSKRDLWQQPGQPSPWLLTCLEICCACSSGGCSPHLGQAPRAAY